MGMKKYGICCLSGAPYNTAVVLNHLHETDQKRTRAREKRKTGKNISLHLQCIKFFMQPSFRMNA